MMPDRRVYLASILVGVATALDALRSLQEVGFHYLDEDVAIYWYAAQEFAHFRFREPFFYGQTYNQLGESLLACPLVGVGVPPWIALPAISMAVGLAPWVILTRIAFRRSAWGLGLALLGAPLVMPVGYQILLSRFFGIGILLVSSGLLVADSSRGTYRWFVAGLLFGLGSLAIYNAVLLAAVVIAWLATTSLRGARAWAALVGGLATATSLWGLGQLFYVLNPGWVVHGAVSLEFRPALILEGLQNLPRHLGRVTPSVFLHPAVLLIVVLLVILAAAWRRQWSVLAPAGAVVAGVIGILMFAGAYNSSPSVFYAYERMFLGLPPALGVVALAGASAKLWPGGTSTRGVLLCAVSVLALAIPKELVLKERASLEFWMPQDRLMQSDVENVRRTCASVEGDARRSDTDLAIFSNRTYAYACGALAYGRLTTLFPPYERRTWLLTEEKSRVRDRVILAGVQEQATCNWVAQRVPGSTCRIGEEGNVAVRFSSSSVIDFAELIGLEVRKFPGASPHAAR